MKANRFVKNEQGYANLIPLTLAVIITFAIIFIGGYINGTIRQELEDSLGTGTIATNTGLTMTNISENWDSTLDIVQVVIIITILAAAVGAIFLFTRFR